MKILIDTHIFLWALSDPGKLNANYRAELETPTNIIYVSAISVAEIMIKSSVGILEVDFDPEEMARQSGFDFEFRRGVIHESWVQGCRGEY